MTDAQNRDFMGNELICRLCERPAPNCFVDNQHGLAVITCDKCREEHRDADYAMGVEARDIALVPTKDIK